ncbi:HNH endonuclease [Bacillus atrophaeus]|uniref:HNH endonuclease n=1 Tax=Bacillus atrophaeus TaxID=1452 RepID=UPI00227DE544|nr:HNH endonuclease signature motif containing protein [Bacillus atrophaeus]MCY8971464.1 HNH endonuclease [Bacillus atrophaeus]
MRYCISNGCTSLVEEGTYYCADHKPRKRKRNGFQSPNKSFYRTEEWKDMRSYVYQRDKGVCQCCGKFVFGRDAHVHHIEPISERPDLKLDEENLILYCPKCHAEEENKNKKKSPPTIFQKYF